MRAKRFFKLKKLSGFQIPHFFYFSIRESFSDENPWVPRITGYGAPGLQIRRRGYIWLSILGVAAYGIFGCARLLGYLFPPQWQSGAQWIKDNVLLGFWTTGSVGAMGCLAAWGAFAGWQARRRMEKDRLLPEATMSILTGPDYMAPIHGRILLLTLAAFLYAVAGYSGLAILMWTDSPQRFQMPFILLGTIAVVFCGTAGIYYRATLLATEHFSAGIALSTGFYYTCLSGLFCLLRLEIARELGMAVSILLEISSPSFDCRFAVSCMVFVCTETVVGCWRLLQSQTLWQTGEMRAVHDFRLAAGFE